MRATSKIWVAVWLAIALLFAAAAGQSIMHVPVKVRGQQVLLPVSFQGTLDSVVDSFMRVHPDIQDSREQVAKTIRTKAEDMRILPLLSLPITLPTGSPAQFNWFKGDTIEAAVRHFATVHRLDASAASLLNKHAVDKAHEQRLLPILQESINLGKGSATVTVFKGDNIDSVSASFVSNHGMGEREAWQLSKHLHSRARDLGHITPQADVPVKTAGADGATTDIVVPVYASDDPARATTRHLGHADADKASAVADYLILHRIRPVLYPDIGNLGSLKIFYGDDPEGAVMAFARRHGLNYEQHQQVLSYIMQRWRDPNDVNPKYIASPPAKEGSATATTEAAHNATEMQTSASHDEAAPRAGRSMSAWLLETLGNLMSPTNMILTGAILMGTAVLLLLRETQQEAGAEGEEGVKMENNALFQSEGGQDEEDEGEEGEEGEEDGDKPAEGEEEEEEEQEEEEEHEEKEEEEQDAGQRSVARRRRK